MVGELSNLQRPAGGGFIPPGIPGHAPDIGLGFDPDLASQLMKDAGYSQDHAFPHIRLSVTHPLLPIANQLTEQWRSVLRHFLYCRSYPKSKMGE